jgi:hypothetical protein
MSNNPHYLPLAITISLTQNKAANVHGGRILKRGSEHSIQISFLVILRFVKVGEHMVMCHPLEDVRVGADVARFKFLARFVWCFFGSRCEILIDSDPLKK